MATANVVSAKQQFLALIGNLCVDDAATFTIWLDFKLAEYKCNMQDKFCYAESLSMVYPRWISNTLQYQLSSLITNVDTSIADCENASHQESEDEQQSIIIGSSENKIISNNLACSNILDANTIERTSYSFTDSIAVFPKDSTSTYDAEMKAEIPCVKVEDNTVDLVCDIDDIKDTSINERDISPILIKESDSGSCSSPTDNNRDNFMDFSAYSLANSMWYMADIGQHNNELGNSPLFSTANSTLNTSTVSKSIKCQFTCPECYRRFLAAPDIRKHLSEDHGLQVVTASTISVPESGSEVVRWVCAYCGKISALQTNAWQHVLMCHCNALYFCELCGKGVRHRGDLGKHMKSTHKDIFNSATRLST